MIDIRAGKWEAGGSVNPDGGPFTVPGSRKGLSSDESSLSKIASSEFKKTFWPVC